MANGMDIGVSGMKANANKLKTHSHNAANAGTTAFKKSDGHLQTGFCDVMTAASKPSGNIGGINPIEIGMGAQMVSTDKIMTQGNAVNSNRTMDFMISNQENAFFGLQSVSGEMLVTRDGRFKTDVDGSIVDSLGNQVLGFNINPETGMQDQVAMPLKIPSTQINASATTEVAFSAGLDDSVDVVPGGNYATDTTDAWQLFSGGEYFGSMDIAHTGGGGQIANYGSGYYQESRLIQDTAATLATAGSVHTVTLAAANAAWVTAPASSTDNLIQVGDTVTLLDGAGHSIQAKVLTVAAGAVTVDNVGAVVDGTVTITNVSRGTAMRGSSGGGQLNDILHSQISMIDETGKLVANFYRVADMPKGFAEATATTITSGSTITIGTGEFTDMAGLKSLIEATLKEKNLTNNPASLNTTVSTSLDKYGAITISGTGLTNTFRFVVNADNAEMRDRLGGLVFSGAANTTQAYLDVNGKVLDAPGLSLGTHSGGATKSWFTTNGLQSYGYNATNPATEYGEFAGLRLDGSNNGSQFGVLQLSLVNALGKAQTVEYSCVPRNAQAANNEFTTLGDLSKLISSTLCQSQFSSMLDATGALVSDPTASCSIVNGRLSVSTSSGSFNNLKLAALNTTTTADITRSDAINFGSVLGQLGQGVYGKSGSTNRFIKADAAIPVVSVYDSQGFTHTGFSYFIKDRSAGFTNVSEWKFKLGLDPNLNYFTQVAGVNDPNTYVQTFNTLSDDNNSRGVLAFDLKTNAIYSTGQVDPRYKSSGSLGFTTQNLSQQAAASNVIFGFDKVVAYASHGSSVSGQKINGFAGGRLQRLTTDGSSGCISGVYSNGEIRPLAKLGLAVVSNPEGLESVGSSCYRLTGNASIVGTIFAISSVAGAQGSNGPKIQSGQLEGSNVDIIEEMTGMMSTQRNYSASAKSITTADELLQEALSLKR